MNICTCIKLKTVDQRLTAVQQPILASGDVGTVRVEYALDSYWEGLILSGSFYNGKRPEDVYEQLLTEGACEIPWEALQEDGVLYIGLRGVDKTGRVKTAAPVRYRVEKGTPSGSATAAGPTPDVYQRFLTMVRETEEIAQSVRNDADNGVFNGKDGKDGDTGPAGPAGVHVGTEAPTDGQTVWIDTDEEPEEEPEGSGTKIDVVANVGQVIAVKAVGADSKPTEFEAVDLPKVTHPDFSANEGEEGHILNRTHYIDEKGIVHKLSNKYINADWMATSVEQGGTPIFYADLVFTENTNIAFLSEYGGGFKVDPGFEFDVYWGGVKYVCPLKEKGGEPYIGNGSLALGAEDTGEPFCLYGVFLAPDLIYYVKKNTTTAETISLYVTVKSEVFYNKLPEEFLPDGVVKSVNGAKPDDKGNVQIETGGGSGIDVIAEVGQTIVVEEVDASGKPTKWKSADYQPRTHYAISEETEVIPQTDITVSGGIYQGGIAPTIEIGRTYTVTFDGVEYECVCSRTNPYYDGTEVAGNVLGNKALMLSNDTNTGEPFCFLALDLGIWGIACASGTHTLKVTGEVDTFVQKIPEKYYTDTKPYYVNIFWEMGTNTATVLNNSFADIEYARTNNIPIYFRVTVMIGDDINGSLEAPMTMTQKNLSTGNSRWYFAYVFAGTLYFEITVKEQNDGTVGANVVQTDL